MTIQATWTIELWADCPKCLEYVDLLDYSDFWDGKRKLQIAEHPKTIDVTCPECFHEFEVTTTY